MSDIRFIMVGALVIFSGFIILGIFSQQYQTANIQKNEFGSCFEYFEDKGPIEIDCSEKTFQQNLLFGIVIALIVGGIVLLIKGLRGNWDNKVKPEDMVGPSRDNRSDESPSS